MESTRSKLIHLLQDREREYVSGQVLSEALNISRSAIWKHMKELEKDGYTIEAAPRKGYRIVHTPDKLSANTVKWGLETNWLGQRLHHYSSVGSTQLHAHEFAQQNAEHGTVVLADEQTRGRGRLNRSWHSRKGEGVWMSMLLRPEIEPHRAPQMTLLAATVLAEVLKTHCGMKPQIKWPNDILSNGKKLAGILTELQAEHDQIQYIVLGTGINVNHEAEHFPEEIQSIATSVRNETGQSFELTPFIQALLQTFEKRYEEYMEHGFQRIKLRWEAFAYRIGERVVVKTAKREWRALLLGIEPDGALKVCDEDGKEEILYSAEIKWGKDEDENT
ncbi:biotin--acetyl-CoA-carboxylase ligase [Pontibacillus halophilus JSM 076056 = DSM 19796]|uniref:Bifunctional ligase/repressor BirA n=1 Tax=Pontibacillus halophilus JSM 076056 = DSM 19796 TaxID=1385510 RepID=A0A0A5GFW5_9BACI|nr:biotin--[acetyl-CoA-carboxylase] ligase [Pontibacillus halophilus]KGX92141.1 biotin--acetyl-CoA-carboxylase ligase [Pontibacillus halophilus JSM 076056 = DSM 19796]